MTCAACGYCITAPRPTPQTIGKYYESKNYISHTSEQQDLASRCYRAVRAHTVRAKYRLIRRHEPHGRVLDIGCGTGLFPAHLQSRGYTVQGVEPSATARAQAIADHALEVLPELDLVPPQEQFDIITLWHVLEHVHAPTETMKKLHARLKRHGFLVIAVPDRDSWDAQHYGPDWAAYDVPRHLSHFRQQDIRRLLEQQGFALTDVRHMWFDAPYVSMLSERHRGRGPLAALVRGVVVGMLSNTIALLGRRPTSSSLFLARKA